LNKFKSENINHKTANISSPSDKKLEFQEFTTKNGISCVLYKNNANPIINVTLGYKVGSKDEPENKKGIAHLFEHMMFQGSDNVPSGDHFKYIQGIGGVCNAFTMQDMTVYYDIVPSNRLEAALWLESDRMNSLDFTDDNVNNQKQVVIEEKKQRYDNAPYGMAFHNIFRTVMKGSSYESPVIGYEDDILSFSLAEAIQFHKTYYSPRNSYLVISGDVDIDKSFKLVEKYFGDIENNIEPPRQENVIRDIKGDIYTTIYDDVSLPVIFISFMIPKSGTDEEYTMDYFANIIANDKSSRLYKKLIYDMQIAKSVHAVKYQLEDGGLFIFRAELMAGGNPELVENIIYEEINDIIDNGFTDYEFEKIRNGIEFYNISILSTLQKIGLETLFNKMLFDDVDLINRKSAKYLSYSKDEIQASISKWFKDRNKFVMKYIPKKDQ
jgi:zinc protease